MLIVLIAIGIILFSLFAYRRHYSLRVHLTAWSIALFILCYGYWNLTRYEQWAKTLESFHVSDSTGWHIDQIGYYLLLNVVLFFVIGITALIFIVENQVKKAKDQEDVRQAEERVRLMLESSPLGCQIFDEHFNVVDCNIATVKLFNVHSKQEYLDRYNEFMPPTQPCGRSSQELVAENITAAFRDGYYHFEWVIQAADGTLIPVDITLVRVLYHNDNAIVAHARDLRELKKKEEERQLYALELEKTAVLAEQAKKEAEAANQIKSDFLANISHELRTPLNAIIGLSQAMLYMELDEQQHRYVNDILTAGKSLDNLISDILDFSHTASDNWRIYAEPFNLGELVHSIIGIFVPSAAEKHLEFSASIDPKLPSIVHGVIGRIRQVLIIIVSNAIKFTKQGSIRIDVSQKSVVDGNMRVLFQVIDTGIGIAVHQHDKCISCLRRYGHQPCACVAARATDGRRSRC